MNAEREWQARGMDAAVPSEFDAAPRTRYIVVAAGDNPDLALIELVERLRDPAADVLAVTMEAYGERDDDEDPGP